MWLLKYNEMIYSMTATTHRLSLMESPILGGMTRTEKFSTFGLEVTAAFTLASAESITIASKVTDSATATLLCPYHRLTVVSWTC